MAEIVIVNRHGLDMWFQDDIAKMLAGVDIAALCVLDNVPANPAAAAYRAGHVNAMRAVCAAFGLEYRT